MEEDVGPPADTTLGEGVVIREDTGPPGDTSPDATPDAALSTCGGGCDPTGRPTAGRGCLDAAVCVLTGEAPSCSATPGSLPLGSACEMSDACAAGLACFRAGRTAGGVCAPICCPGDAETCVEGRCAGDGILVDGTATAFGRCAPPRRCDVLAPELTCEAREGCYVVDATGTTECRIAGTRDAGETCMVPEDCATGLFCGGLGPRTCLRICAIDMPRACEADERCVAQSYSPAGSGICVSTASLRH